jgi:lipid-binding SYLF domain-containing protein
MSQRREDGSWSQPAFIEIGGGSFGPSLDGSVIGIDDSANAKVYGKNVTGEQILLGKAVQTNATVEPLMKALQKVSPPHVYIKKEPKS